MQPPVLLRGEYQATIENWEKHFAGQILYLFYDDVVESPSNVLGRVCEFLGVDPARLSTASGQDERVNDVPIDQIPAPVREALESHYAPTIRFLEQRFDRSLAHWLSGTS